MHGEAVGGAPFLELDHAPAPEAWWPDLSETILQLRTTITPVDRAILAPLGEFLALAESFRHEANKGNARAGILADTLDKATEKLLDENKSPARRVGQIDNRGSHFWIANYWAQELAGQHDDAELAAAFADVAAALKDNAEAIDAELISVQGSPADIGGYYRPEDAKASAVMRPSSRFNEILAQLG